MIEQFVDMCLILFAALVYGYIFVLVCSHAYFQSKLRYQNLFFLNFDRNSNRDGVA